MHVAHTTVYLWRSKDSRFVLVLCFHHMSSGDSNRLSSLAANAYGFRAVLPVLAFAFNSKGSQTIILNAESSVSGLQWQWALQFTLFLGLDT